MSEELLALSPAEAARRLGVSQNTIYRLIMRGELRAVKVGRVWRVPVAALQEYLARSNRTGETATEGEKGGLALAVVGE